MSLLASGTIATRDQVRRERIAAPPKSVCVLLPVWGREYIRQFLNYSLPTLLAPGNIPALAATLPCRFVAMTRTSDAHWLRQHSAWRRLSSYCSVDLLYIDDLITVGNHSTTITLAFQRAVMATGHEKCDTCFFFLVSDYIVADGSLAAVLRRMQAGASAVQTTNLQCIDDALDGLFARFLPAEGAEAGDLDDLWSHGGNPVAIFRPRELVSLALDHLHPAMLANTMDFPACHNSHTNRLFWQAGRKALVGRYFLMHMLCIRPETDTFTIGASCDYSFIPEMCPSGNVEAITDSDEYLAVEGQPRGHEWGFLRPGPLTAEGLVSSLEEWTTAHHRANLQHTVIFHAGDLDSAVAEARSRSDKFVADVIRRLSSTPAPHRDHPYWRGAIAAHRRDTGQTLDDDDWAALRAASGRASRGRLVDMFTDFQTWLVGHPLEYRPWQPRWPDFVDVIDRIRTLHASSGRMLVVTADPIDLANWRSQFTPTPHIVALDFLARPNDVPRPTNPSGFSVALVLLDAESLTRAEHLPRRLLPMLTACASVIVVIANPRQRRLRRFNQDLCEHVTRLFDIRLRTVAVHYVPVSRSRAIVQRAMASLARRAVRQPLAQGLPGLVAGSLLALVSRLLNRRARASDARVTVPPRCSSVAIEFRVDGANPEGTGSPSPAKM